MGNSGLLQKLSDITALLAQVGPDGEQSSVVDFSLAGLDGLADVALNHRLAQGMLGSVVGRVGPTGLQNSPKAIGQLQEQLAVVRWRGPRGSLAAAADRPFALRVLQDHHAGGSGLPQR